MMPENALSSSPVPRAFVGARSLPITKILDYEDGGVALQDASMGVLYQRWRAMVINAGTTSSYVQLDAREVDPFTLIELPNITEISISFDVLMRPVLAYVQNGSPFLRWYDPVAAAYVTTALAADVITPKVSLDDKRFAATQGYQTNDVILAYVRGTTLYYRQQRDRFTIERELAVNVKPLIKIGFNRGLRLQFMHEV